MSVLTVEMYTLGCDGVEPDGSECGEVSTENGDFAAWAHVDSAIDEATANDWLIVDGKHYCPEHAEGKRCEPCGETENLTIDSNGKAWCADCVAEGEMPRPADEVKA